MKTEVSNTLAEKLAKIIEGETQPSPDLSAVFASLEKISHRLDKLEQSAVAPRAFTSLSSHPSLDKLSIAEAIADEIFAGVSKEKACQFEPDKPCDHCSMCNSRGF